MADIHDVADPAWLTRVRTETGAEPLLDDDGAVVIPVVSGSGPVLQGAPPDCTIKLPALGAHQARVAVALGASTLQRVIIDAHEQLEEILLAGTGRIDDLTVNASRDDLALKLTGDAAARVLRHQGGSFAIHPNMFRPTAVIDLRDTGVEVIGGSEGRAAELRLSGYVQARSSCRARSSLVTPGAIIDTPAGVHLWLGIVNLQQGGQRATG